MFLCCFLMFRFFRISPSVIFHFRFISGIFRRYISSFPGYCAFAKCSVLFPSRFPVHPCRMSEAFCFVCSLTSGIFLSCISHHFRFNSGLFRRHMFGSFRPSYFIISASFPEYSVVTFPEICVLHVSSFPLHFRIIPSSYFRKFPLFIFHHFRFISGLLRRHISGNFRPSYFIISASFPDYCVVIFPEISVLHISSFPLHFRIIPLSCFRKFPPFIFHHFRFISGLFHFGRPRHF